jgi:hypothetical protein
VRVTSETAWLETISSAILCVVRGDLEGVEENACPFWIHGIFGDRDHDLADGELDGSTVLERRQLEGFKGAGEAGGPLPEAGVEVTERLADQSRERAGEPHFPPEVLMCRHSGVMVSSCKWARNEKGGFRRLELVCFSYLLTLFYQVDPFHYASFREFLSWLE